MSGPPTMSDDDVRLRSVIPLITVNCAIGVFFLVALVPEVSELYERGYGRFSAVAEFVILPSIGLVLSVGVPAWLCWLRANRVARMMAILFLFFMWLPYLGFVGGFMAI